MFEGQPSRVWRVVLIVNGLSDSCWGVVITTGTVEVTPIDLFSECRSGGKISGNISQCMQLESVALSGLEGMVFEIGTGTSELKTENNVCLYASILMVE